MENINWPQVGAFFVPVLGLGLAGLAYLTRQFNRINDRITRVEEHIIRVEQRLGDRIARLEQQQARLEERMNERFGRIDERFDRVEASVNERFDRVDERFDRLEASVDERFDRVEESVSQVWAEMKSLGEDLQNVEKEQARMLGFLEGRGVMGKAPAAETVS